MSTICSIVPLAHSLDRRGAGSSVTHPVALLAPHAANAQTSDYRTSSSPTRGAPSGLGSPARPRQALHRAAAARGRAGPDALLGLPVADPARRPRRAPGSHGEPDTRPFPPRIAARSRSPGPPGTATPAWGCTWHYMDAELDTGNTLPQGTVAIEDDDVDIEEFSRKLQANASRCCRARSSGWQPAIRATSSRTRARAGPGTSKTTTTFASTGARPPARSTTRCGPGISRSASPGSAHRSPTSTASRSFCCRRGSPIPVAMPAAWTAGTARSGSSPGARLAVSRATPRRRLWAGCARCRAGCGRRSRAARAGAP